ncbi:nucleotidyl transferase AbiEii/AbiGii toxin family protein [Clavibacter michiganensis]
MPDPLGYSSGPAARAAIKTAAQKAAQGASPSVGDLIKQTMFDRFLCRVFADDEPMFVLKGGTGMLARMPRSRSTLDIDLAATEGALDAAVDELVQCASRDLGDHFRFVYKSRTELLTGENQPYTSGCRVTFDAYLGVTSHGKIGIDLAVGHMPTAKPERRAPANRLTQLKFRTYDYLLYPLVDQVSDKLCATIQVYGPEGRPSSREKDLVDLAMIASFETVDATELRVAVSQEFLLRSLEPVDHLTAPEHWGLAYRRMAATTPLADHCPRIEDAVELVSSFLDPVLDGTTTEGRLDPATSTRVAGEGRSSRGRVTRAVVEGDLLPFSQLRLAHR